MKIRVGTRLLAVRQDRKLTRAEMADILGISPPTYSRLEQNESSVDMEQVVNFSKILQVPVQEFLPETISISGSNHNGQIGLVIGTVNHFADKETANEIEKLHIQLDAKNNEVDLLRKENKHLKQIISLMEAQNSKTE